MRIEMIGRKFGSLTVLKKYGVYKGYDTQWLCRCNCGHYAIVRGSFLRNGHTKTCGDCTHYINEDSHIRCVTGSGRSFIFDAEDFPTVSQFRWSIDSHGYALSQDKGKQLKLHRLLLGAKAGEVVDHINGNPQDCRRENLRVASQHQNTYNSKLPKSSSTGYKGVCFDKRRGKYMAHIHPSGKCKFLGYFDSAEDAAHAYDRAASSCFREFAKLNFKEETDNDQSEEVLALEKRSRH